MGMISNLSLVLAMWIAAASAACADAQPPKDGCYGIKSFDGGMLKVGRVSKSTVADPRYSTDPMRKHFKAGELVILTKMENGYACVQEAMPGNEIMDGWVPADNVQILPASKSRPSTRWWLGYWNSNGSKILFQILDKRFWASGSSTWQGFGEPHFGDFEGHPFPYGDGFRITEADKPDAPDDTTSCTVKMIAVGSYMVVVDSGGCGGTNVSFTGIYSRSHARHR